MKSALCFAIASLSALGAAAALPADSLLTGHPYLQNPAPDAITVMFTSPEAIRSQASWSGPPTPSPALS